MGKYDIALKKLQNERLEVSSKIERDDSDNSDNWLDIGFVSGIEKAEEILYELQKQTDRDCNNLWYTGSPNDIKPNNRGTYILIMRACFDSEDGIENGKIYIDTDFWDGEKWEGFETGDDRWDVLYFAKLKWIWFPLPKELGIKRTDDLFFN